MIRKIKHSQSQRTDWTFYGDIKSYDQYSELCEELYNSQEGDVVVLKINSPGGNVDVGSSILHAIDSTNARVIAEVVMVLLCVLIHTLCFIPILAGRMVKEVICCLISNTQIDIYYE